MYSIKRDVNGLIMIAASLLIIAVVLVLIGHEEVRTRRDHIRAAGSGLTQSLSRIPPERLAPTSAHSGFLPLIRATQSQTSFAYATIVSPSGEVLKSVTNGEVAPPLRAVVSKDPGSWRDERLFSVGDPGRWVREFDAPVLVNGELVAQIRVGYFEPNLRGILIGSSVHAKIALVVFMLMPLASLWLRREIRPLAVVASELDAGEDASNSLFESDAGAAHDIPSLAERIQSFKDSMDERNTQMTRERLALLASSKVLAHQKGRAEVVFQGIPDAVFALDSSGRVVDSNQRATSLLRRPKEELNGTDIRDWSPAPEVTELVLKNICRNGRILRPESVDYSPEDSLQRRHRASLHPSSDESIAILLIRDISEEEAARKSQSEFLAHMAHELKAPLNVMALYSESLLETDARDDTVRIDACNVIGDEIDRLNGLINNIFSISRIEGGAVSLDRQRVRISEMLEDLFESSTRDGETLKLEFFSQIPNDLSPVFVDKQLFSIAIKNILSNAIKYNRMGGSVSLLVEDDEAGLSIRIRDTGPGIPEDDIPMIFQKFFRSEDDSVSKVSGHGLGLSLVKEIVVLHGGEIQVTSELGTGSEFALIFDRSAPIFREGI